MHFHHTFRDVSVADKYTWVREVVRVPFPCVHQKISMFIACGVLSLRSIAHCDELSGHAVMQV